MEPEGVRISEIRYDSYKRNLAAGLPLRSTPPIRYSPTPSAQLFLSFLRQDLAHEIRVVRRYSQQPNQQHTNVCGKKCVWCADTANSPINSTQITANIPTNTT